MLSKVLRENQRQAIRNIILRAHTKYDKSIPVKALDEIVKNLGKMLDAEYGRMYKSYKTETDKLKLENKIFIIREVLKKNNSKVEIKIESGL